MAHGSSAVHESFMREAIAESAKALPGCLPNPPVGCVVVLNGRVISRGYTNPPGHPHAEAMALRSLVHPAEATQAWVYVTLEPCSFNGRTPSCAEALVSAHVARVFVGIIDPHPRNRGRGIEILRAAGIAVEIGILADEIHAALTPYLIQS